MKFYLGYDTARQYWLNALSSMAPRPAPIRDAFLPSAPSGPEWDAAEGLLAARHIEAPYHVLVSTRADLRKRKTVVSHLQKAEMPGYSFCKLSDGIYIASPELAFVQSATTMSRFDLLYLGYSLCASFATDRYSPTGTTDAKPVTNAQQIRLFAKRAKGLHGVGEAELLSRYIIDGAASPTEIMLAMVLSLPTKMGGFGLPLPQLNVEFELDSNRKTTYAEKYRADLCWTKERVIVEYDGEASHKGPEKTSYDKRRRNDLEDLGYSVIVAEKSHFESPSRFEALVLQIAHQMKYKIRPERFEMTYDRRLTLEEIQKRLFKSASEDRT